MVLVYFLSAVVGLLSVFVFYFKWKQQYWQRRGLQVIPGTIPFGSLPSPTKRTEPIGVTLKNYYLKFRSQGLRHIGLYAFALPEYMVLDLTYLKNIMTKDFQFFVDRGIYYNEEDDPISAHLFAIGGAKWKNLRYKLTPTFTSGKMKTMFPIMVECLSPMIQSLEQHHKNNSPINIKEVLGCFTTDIIGSCAFGLECNTFSEDNSPFRVYCKKFFKRKRIEQIKFAFLTNFGDLGRRLRFRAVAKDTSEFFTEVVKETIDYREKNNCRRADFLQLLIDMKNKNGNQYNRDGKTLTLEEIVAQSFIFFVAGFETSSTTMAFVLYELARNPDIQNKVREEIEQVLKKHDGKISPEALHEMKYMEQVMDESLRKYPPFPFLTRVCVKDYKIPDCDVTIEAGTRILIPVMGIHYDPEYWSEPEKFDPDRFSDENRQSIHQYSHIPFGEGPRICIGLRFGVMQTKIGLASLLRKYKFTVNAKTLEPLEFDWKMFFLTAKGDIWLNISKV